jgi:DNA polymerase elongation subunit (family B)
VSGDHLAFDIETIPSKELSGYSSIVQQKIESKISRIQERNPDYSYDQFASIHGDFSRIICISLGYITNESKIKLKSIYGEDEKAILREFNQIIKTFRGVFLHYNGLNFDCPSVLQRMAHNKIKISNTNFKILRRYSQEPHFDLMMHYYNWD